MHDISLGLTIQDYLTGEDIEATTYEDLRQGLARLLVEEKGYPAERLAPRVNVRFPIEGKEYARQADLAAYDETGRPLLLLLFCSGNVTTYERETLAAARLLTEGPAPLAIVTDSKDAALLETATGRVLAEGVNAIPDWATLQELAAEHPRAELDEERAKRERRILYAYSESLYTCCSAASCAIESRGGRWSG